MSKENEEHETVFDVDTVAYLMYCGFTPEAHYDGDTNRVGFKFDTGDVSGAKMEMAMGKALVEVNRWSSIIRSLHSNFLSPSAKATLR